MPDFTNTSTETTSSATAIPVVSVSNFDEYPDKVQTKDQAKAVISRLAQSLPQTKSAYQPSGAMPPGALARMALGAVAGAPLAALTGIIAAVVGVLVLFVLVYILKIAFSDMPGIVTAVLGLIFGTGVLLVGLFCIVGPWLLTGYVAGWCTTRLGKAGKNRSVVAAGIMSAISAALAAVILALAASQPSLNQGNDVPTVALVIIFGIIGVMALITAVVSSNEMVRQAKFCEECEMYMTKVPGKPVNLESLKAMAKAVYEGNAAEAANLSHETAARTAGKAMVFACDKCGKGFLDLQASVSVAYGEGAEAQTWLVASMPLGADETKLFEPELAADLRG